MDILLRSVTAILALWSLVMFLLLIHETGHLIALEAFKLKPDRIMIGNIKLFTIRVGGLDHEIGLFPFFAFTISNDYARAPHWQRAIVAAAGPITSFALAGLLWLWNMWMPGWYTNMAAGASFALGVWNLIPFPPMDGWAILEWRLVKRGIKISERGRTILLGMGITSIAVLAVMAWD